MNKYHKTTKFLRKTRASLKLNLIVFDNGSQKIRFIMPQGDNKYVCHSSVMNKTSEQVID